MAHPSGTAPSPTDDGRGQDGVYGIYKKRIYERIKPTKIALNETAVSTPAECAALVHRDYREATAAEYSNTGGEWCFAVFEATGVIFDPTVQTCVFEKV